MFKVKYVDSIMMLVRLDLNLIVPLFQHKCEVSETVSTTTLVSDQGQVLVSLTFPLLPPPHRITSREGGEMCSDQFIITLCLFVFCKP